MAASIGGLVSVFILEKDAYKDVVWAWSYPSVSEDERKLVQTNAFGQPVDEEEEGRMIICQFNNTWYYIYTVNAESELLPKVEEVCLGVCSREFNPGKMEAFCALVARLYLESASPPKVLDAFLNVATRGRYEEGSNGAFSAADYDPRQAFVSAPVKALIQTFGMETVLLYVAMLIKRRILVYHPSPAYLSDLTRALPALAVPRRDWACLYPVVGGDQLQHISRSSHYVAGVTDGHWVNRFEVYDVFADLAAGEISIAPHAREDLTLSKLHKDVASDMVTGAGRDSVTDSAIIKGVANKTKEMLGNLKGLVGEEGGELSLELIREKGFPRATENFLFNLAVAEGLIRVTV